MSAPQHGHSSAERFAERFAELFSAALTSLELDTNRAGGWKKPKLIEWGRCLGLGMDELNIIDNDNHILIHRTWLQVAQQPAQQPLGLPRVQYIEFWIAIFSTLNP